MSGPQKLISINVYGNFIYIINSPELETTQMPIKRKIDKEIVV